MSIFNFLLFLHEHLEQTYIKYQNATEFNLEIHKHAEVCTITRGLKKYKENECLLKKIKSKVGVRTYNFCLCSITGHEFLKSA